MKNPEGERYDDPYSTADRNDWVCKHQFHPIIMKLSVLIDDLRRQIPAQDTAIQSAIEKENAQKIENMYLQVLIYPLQGRATYAFNMVLWDITQSGN